MPIYEYKCSECGHVLDALQGVNEAPLEECPECSKSSLKKLISAPNFRLSGDGWYETDFKTENRKNIADGAKKRQRKKNQARNLLIQKQKRKKRKRKIIPQTKIERINIVVR